MTTTLPGGLWYPERHALGAYLDALLPQAGDAAGAVFSFSGALRSGGAAARVRFGPSSIRLSLLDPAETVLGVRDWSPGHTTSPAGVADVVIWVEWTTDVDLAADVAYRLIVTNLGSTEIRMWQQSLSASAAGLGHKVTRVGGVWTEDATRRVAVALRVTGL